MTMITKAVVVINDTPSIEVTGQQLIQAPEDESICGAGEDMDAIRNELEVCFRQLFPDSDVNILFPELGECS